MEHLEDRNDVLPEGGVTPNLHSENDSNIDDFPSDIREGLSPESETGEEPVEPGEDQPPPHDEAGQEQEDDRKFWHENPNLGRNGVTIRDEAHAREYIDHVTEQYYGARDQAEELSTEVARLRELNAQLREQNAQNIGDEPDPLDDPSAWKEWQRKKIHAEMEKTLGPQNDGIELLQRQANHTIQADEQSFRMRHPDITDEQWGRIANYYNSLIQRASQGNVGLPPGTRTDQHGFIVWDRDSMDDAIAVVHQRLNKADIQAASRKAGVRGAAESMRRAVETGPVAPGLIGASTQAGVSGQPPKVGTLEYDRYMDQVAREDMPSI